MANMSYCRFENTLADMKDCLEHIHDEIDVELNPDEHEAREEMLEIAKRIVDEHPSA